jgi:hypothetical protein
MQTEPDRVSPRLDGHDLGISTALFWVLLGGLATICLVVVLLELG